MNHLRTDNLTGRSVIIAEARANRPTDLRGADVARPVDERDYHADCPFCAGNEAVTPHAYVEVPDGQGGWRLRVVPNKYPAVAPDAPVAGSHEVIVESPRHLTRMGQLTVDELAAVVQLYAARLATRRAEGRTQYELVFKNLGAAGGASLEHVHSQLIALADPPPLAAREAKLAEQHYAERQECVLCARLREELADGSRIVAERAGFVALCPAASRQPYETWIVPTDHAATPDRLRTDAAHARALAELLHPLLSWIESARHDIGYNLMLISHARGEPAAHHWRLEIVPRFASFAGFELAAGLYLNAVAPERAAAVLRATIGQTN